MKARCLLLPAWSKYATKRYPVVEEIPAETPFRSELAKRIRATIRANKSCGTTGMSLECLRQCTPPPSHLLEGAPRGTNAGYFYAEMFRFTVNANTDMRSFIIA